MNAIQDLHDQYVFLSGKLETELSFLAARRPGTIRATQKRVNALFSDMIQIRAQLRQHGIVIGARHMLMRV
jgi:hypothetical protein